VFCLLALFSVCVAVFACLLKCVCFLGGLCFALLCFALLSLIGRASFHHPLRFHSPRSFVRPTPYLHHDPTPHHTTQHNTQGGWPLPASYAQFACRPPPALAAYMEAFTAFYHSLDVGRGKRLEWVLREVSACVRACVGLYLLCVWVCLFMCVWGGGGRGFGCVLCRWVIGWVSGL
jgi:hypothetical protein